MSICERDFEVFYGAEVFGFCSYVGGVIELLKVKY